MDVATEPRTMAFDALPARVQELLRVQFVAEMRKNYALIEREVLEMFLAQEPIAEQWAAYHEAFFQAELHSVDSECAWDEWLCEHGVT